MDTNFFLDFDIMSDDFFDSFINEENETIRIENDSSWLIQPSSSTSPIFSPLLPPPSPFADVISSNDTAILINQDMYEDISEASDSPTEELVNLRISKNNMISTVHCRESIPSSDQPSCSKTTNYNYNESSSPTSRRHMNSPVSTHHSSPILIPYRRRDSSTVCRRGMGAYCNKQVPRLRIHKEATNEWKVIGDESPRFTLSPSKSTHPKSHEAEPRPHREERRYSPRHRQSFRKRCHSPEPFPSQRRHRENQHEKYQQRRHFHNYSITNKRSKHTDYRRN